ncbi:unnamed protein product [Cuscuta europaea]|uniref:RanBD1 domain-containing protein n=1 Tax=Cuscuta europaea TaxID=41803 RepID=A0A9P0YYU8_CUSEU|nr:unnamed protein product [Cuscuta europaea]
MENAENVLPPSKKRAAGRELSRDNPGLDDDEVPEQESGTFKKASEEVMANRRIVKVRRHMTPSTPAAPSSNPFAGICLVSPGTVPLESKDEIQATKVDRIEEKHDVNKDSEEGKAYCVFEVPSEHNVNKGIKAGRADTGKETDAGKSDVDREFEEVNDDENKEADKGKSDVDKEKQPEKQTSEAEGVVSTIDKNKMENEPNKQPETVEADEKTNGNEKDTSEKTVNEDQEGNYGNPSSLSSFQHLSSTRNAFTGLAGTGFSGSTFSFGPVSKDGPTLADQSSLSFGGHSNDNVSIFGGPAGFQQMQEVPVQTGEEDEKPVFTADSALFEFLDGGWKERGKGEVKVNVSKNEMKKGRLVMRSRGNCRLILNANLYPEMKLTNMDKKAVTFACINSASGSGGNLVTFALKFKDSSFVEEFRAAVAEHKGCPEKTPNSPDASEV